MAFAVVLLDLDGVVRHFDPRLVSAVEARHHLAPGALRTAAFHPDLLDHVVTGHISRRQWAERIGREVGNLAAVHEWLADRGSIDPSMLDLVDEIRAAGSLVAILTNGTDTIPAELAELGVHGRFDRVFNSAELGVAKPDRRCFELACHELAVDARDVFFTDDTAANVEGARAIGMTAVCFAGVDALRVQLVERSPLRRSDAGRDETN